jgi:2-C-methyl-D-erythritol 4-phosphate cytidylyltransferase
MANIAVIVAAAGRSERFGKEKKTFAKVDGRPVVLRAVEMFCSRDDVCQTLLAVAPEDADFTRDKYGANLGFMGVQLVTGGDTRAATIRLALEKIAPKAEYVAVHDAARICTTPAMIDGVFKEAAATAAAILAVPLVGSIKRVAESGAIDDRVSRDGLFEAQTPQVFAKTVLAEAYENAPDDAEDDAEVVRAAGHTVTVVKSDLSNLKITFSGDTALAAAILKSRPKAPPKRSFGAFEEAQW